MVARGATIDQSNDDVSRPRAAPAANPPPLPAKRVPHRRQTKYTVWLHNSVKSRLVWCGCRTMYRTVYPCRKVDDSKLAGNDFFQPVPVKKNVKRRAFFMLSLSVYRLNGKQSIYMAIGPMTQPPFPSLKYTPLLERYCMTELTGLTRDISTFCEKASKTR